MPKDKEGKLATSYAFKAAFWGTWIVELSCCITGLSLNAAKQSMEAPFYQPFMEAMASLAYGPRQGTSTLSRIQYIRLTRLGASVTVLHLIYLLPLSLQLRIGCFQFFKFQDYSSWHQLRTTDTRTFWWCFQMVQEGLRYYWFRQEQHWRAFQPCIPKYSKLGIHSIQVAISMSYEATCAVFFLNSASPCDDEPCGICTQILEQISQPGLPQMLCLSIFSWINLHFQVTKSCTSLLGPKRSLGQIWQCNSAGIIFQIIFLRNFWEKN